MVGDLAKQLRKPQRHCGSSASPPPWEWGCSKRRRMFWSGTMKRQVD